MVMRRLLTLTALLALGFGSASAAIINEYSSQADFLTGISSGSYVETFSSIRWGSSLSYSGNGYSYTASAATDLRSRYGWLQNTWPGEITITFTSGNVTAVGADFFGLNRSDERAGTTITLNFSDGSTRTIEYSPSSATFTGFTFDTPLTYMTMSVESYWFASRWAGLDNLIVGTAAAEEPVSTPEPGAWILLSTGMGLLALSRFTRRRKGA